MQIKIGTLIDGRYRVTAKIGHGGMADIYEATDIIKKTTVAIKMIRDDVMLDSTNLKRFENEALIAASLNHPNIVKVYNHGTIAGVPYIANEYVKGQTLKEVIDFRGALPLEEAVDYMIQLTDALYFAHQHNIVHRDVKPENIFVMPDGTIKLGDFGIAQAEGLDNHLTKTNEIIGSVYYMAPEIAKGNKATPKSDMYAVGVAFFEMFTAHPPFENDSAVNIAVMHIKDKFPSVKKYVPDCPREVEKVIQKATNKDPNLRYNDMEEFNRELKKLKNNVHNLQPKKGLLARIFGFK
ncbi:MAG: serine/threonine protein kinase [Bacilli bacterium]|nr:serine/threonine protein kinase [Bacilli bacterium]